MEEGAFVDMNGHFVGIAFRDVGGIGDAFDTPQ